MHYSYDKSVEVQQDIDNVISLHKLSDPASCGGVYHDR